MAGNGKQQERVVLNVPGRRPYLRLIREVVSLTADSMGFDPSVSLKIEMAVDEACTNIIEHGYEEAQAHPGEPVHSEENIELHMVIERDKISVTVSDRGRPFSPVLFEGPDLDEYFRKAEGTGLGIHLIRKFMDEVNHTYDPEKGNQLRLVKHL